LIFINLKYRKYDAYNLKLDENFEGQLENIELKSGNYSLQNFLFGPYLKYTFFDRVSVFGKTFIGVMSTFKPNQLLTYNQPGLSENEIIVEGKIAASFAFSFGAGIVVKITDRIGFCISTDYIIGRPKLDKLNLENLEIEEVKQNIHLNNYNVGIALAF